MGLSYFVILVYHLFIFALFVSIVYMCLICSQFALVVLMVFLLYIYYNSWLASRDDEPETHQCAANRAVDTNGWLNPSECEWQTRCFQIRFLLFRLFRGLAPSSQNVTLWDNDTQQRSSECRSLLIYIYIYIQRYMYVLLHAVVLHCKNVRSMHW